MTISWYEATKNTKRALWLAFYLSAGLRSTVGAVIGPGAPVTTAAAAVLPPGPVIAKEKPGSFLPGFFNERCVSGAAQALRRNRRTSKPPAAAKPSRA